MSFHYWRNSGHPEKNGFISLRNGYHGETLGTLSVTDVGLFKDIYMPLLRPSAQAPTPDWRCALKGETARDDPPFPGKFFLAALEQELALRPPGNTVYSMPPYITDEQEMDLLVAGTLRALESC